MYEEKSFYIINGLTSNNLQCDSDFTFFSGDRCSQIDVALTNTPDIVSSFKILEKTCYSDHKPISITVSTKVKTQLNLVAACAADTFEYNHYDVNRKPVKNIKRSQLNVDNTVTALENTAEKIKQMLTDNPDMDNSRLCTIINETYTKRYTELTGIKYCHALYETYLREDLRILITRWRMSCLQLEIETGRYH